MPTIRVPFAISARPSEPVSPDGSPVVGVTTFDKVFAGPGLTGSSIVWMVSAHDGSGPLAYVALERVQGRLGDVEGTFVLQHVGGISLGVPSLALVVVAGSGSEGLAGLSGTGTIEHDDDGATLTLTYALPA
jgi:hypothetical protein